MVREPAWRRHAGAIITGFVYLLLSLYYIAATPLWESDNEWSHYHYVRYLLDERKLPDPGVKVPAAPTADLCTAPLVAELTTSHQFRQPPLYYVLGAAAIAPVAVEAQWPVAVNPHVFKDPIRAGYNVMVHDAREAWPWRGAVLAVHLLRLMSGLMGLAGIVATYLAGLIVFEGRRGPALAAMAANAFIPQYVFSSSVVNNDILAGAFGSWCLYFCLVAALRRPGLGAVLLALASAGLAVSSKLTGIYLAPLVFVAAIVGLVRARRAGSSRARRGALAGAILAVLAPLAGAAILAVASPERMRSTLAMFALLPTALGQILSGASGSHLIEPLLAARFSFMTFWGLFGNDLIAFTSPILVMLLALSLIGVVGLAWLAFDRTATRLFRALAVSGGFYVLAVWVANTIRALGTSEPRGRYMLVAYAVASLLLVAGYDQIGRRVRFRAVQGIPAASRSLAWAPAVVLFALALATPSMVIRPAYALPELLPEATLAPGERPLGAVYGGLAELAGYRLSPARIGVFEALDITLVWRALATTPNNYTVSLEVVDGDQRPHGDTHTFPGHGNFATSLWRPGDVFRETYRLYPDDTMVPFVPSLGRVKVTLHCYGQEGDANLPVTGPDGAAAGDAVFLERVKLASASGATGTVADFAGPVQFGDEIGLEGVWLLPDAPGPGDTLSIETLWRALRTPAADYTLFAHLAGADGLPVAGNDRPLTGGRYPSGLWDGGERVADVHELTIPAGLPSGVYTVTLGLYTPENSLRLAARDAHGTGVPGDEWPVLTLTVP